MLKTAGELHAFLERYMIDGNVNRISALIMRVSDEIARKAFEMSDGKLDLNGSYWEVDSDNFYHSKDHIIPQEDGDLPRTNDDFVYAIMHLNEGEVFSATRKKGGLGRIQIGVDRDNRKTIVVSFVCKGRKTGLPTARVKTGWSLTEEKYEREKNSKAPNGRRSQGNDRNPRLADSNNIVLMESENVNEKSVNSKKQFSLKSPVESVGDLVVIHNMHEYDLIKTLKLGGFPMPSIAVMRADNVGQRHRLARVLYVVCKECHSIAIPISLNRLPFFCTRDEKYDTIIYYRTGLKNGENAVRTCGKRRYNVRFAYEKIQIKSRA